MRESTRLVWNAAVNVTTGFVNMAVALFVVPVSVHYLGKEGWGVYGIVAGMAFYSPFMHLGMSSAMVRFSTTHLARREYGEMNAVVNTGLVYYRMMAVVLMLIATCFAFFAVPLFVRDPAYHRAGFWSVMTLGLAESLTMALNPVVTLLRSMERFDLFTIPISIGRILRLAALVLLLPFCDSQSGVVCLTAVMASTNLLPSVARRFLAIRYTPGLKMDFRLARRSLLWPMIGFGVGSIVWQSAMVLPNVLPNLLIGRYLSPEHVSEYDVSNRVFLFVDMILANIMMVMLPTAARFTSTGRQTDLQHLFLRSSKYAAGVSFPFCVAMGILAPLILYLWVGKAFVATAIVLTTLAVGRAVFFVQNSTYNILIGMAKHRVPATISMSTIGLMALVQVIVLTQTGWGVTGAAAVTSAAMLLGWGIGIPLYACREAGIPIRRYYATILIRPILAGVPAFLLWTALRFIALDHPWGILACAIIAGGGLMCLGWWFILFDDWDRHLIMDKLRILRNKIASLRGSAPLDVQESASEEDPGD